MITLFDDVLSDAARISMYRAQVEPDLYPDEKQMLIENWPAEDRAAYCGGVYTRRSRDWAFKLHHKVGL